MTKQSYTGSDIVVLSDNEHVRLRTNVYLGNMQPATYWIPILSDAFRIKYVTFIPAVYKAINEVIDNSIDEFAQTTQKKKVLTINASPQIGSYNVTDNGRGIPIEKHSTGKYTPEVALAQLRAGRNFVEDRTQGVIGTNGVGVSVVNICSSQFNVIIHRDKKRYTQLFLKGASVIGKPSIRQTQTKTTGTQIAFTLDPEVFKDVSLPEELIVNRAQEIALTNPGVEVVYNNTTFKFKHGLKELITKHSKQYYCFSTPWCEFFVIFDMHRGVDEHIFTWVNSSLLFDGGICNTQFLNAFIDKTLNYLEPRAKKNKSEVTKNDVRENLLIIGSLKIKNPEYDAQSKTRLTGPNLRKEFAELLETNWALFTRQQKQWFDLVFERSLVRYHMQANKQAIKQHKKQLNRKIPELLDATSDDRSICRLLITEGLSAASSIAEVRDARTIASLPLSGKINNVYGSTIAELLKMEKLQNLLTTVGLTPGRTAIADDLRYGKIIIATDADHDGSDIFTLLINLFYQFWPELFANKHSPLVFRLLTPNVCAIKGKTRIHFKSLAEFETSKDQYRGWTINYNKGLGSLEQEDWRMVLSDETNLIPIVSDDTMKQTLQLLFSPDVEARKVWLQGEST